MAWQTHKPSFRGVPFQVRSAGQDAGRRVALHEYPQRDTPYAEDLGRKKREFTLEAYLVGPDYAARRDALIAAIEAPGPGTLVHPYRGSVQAVVTACRVQETTDAGGMCTLSITFAEAGINAQPVAAVDTVARVAERAVVARAAAQATFAAKLTTAGKPAFVAAAAVSRLNRAIERINALTKRIGKLDLPLLSEFALDGQRLSAAVSGLVGAPATLARRISDRIDTLRHLADSPLAAWRGLRQLFTFGQDVPPVAPTTPARVAQGGNDAAIAALTRQCALASAADAAAQADFASYQDAIEVREALAIALEAEAETADDTVYQALMDLRAAVVADITVRGADLARIVTFRQPGTLPALVVAHRLYGDAARADEIVARNRLRHPGFVPGGRDLQVLTA